MSEEAERQGMGRQAEKRLEQYLAHVARNLKGVEPGERKGILEEIGTGLREKLEVMAQEVTRPLFTEEVDKVLEDFGTPEEIAKEYAGVAGPALGWDTKGFYLFVAAFAAVMAAMGAFFIADYFGRVSGDLLNSLGEPVWGVFWLLSGAIILGAVGYQLKRQDTVRHLGMFTAATFLWTGAMGALMLGMDFQSVFPDTSDAVSTLVPLVLGLAVVLVGLFGVIRLLRLFPAEKKEKGAKGKKGAADRTATPRGLTWFAAGATVLLVSLAVLGNGIFLLNLNSPMAHRGDKAYIGAEDIGGPYNTRIEKWETYTGEYWAPFNKVVYTFNGTELEGAFQSQTRPALDWIKANTTQNATVLSWWDYGHSIRGYALRSSVIYYPSQSLLATVADKNSVKQFEPEERVKAVAEILLSENSTDMKAKMGSIGATHIMTGYQDADGIAYAILKAAGKDPDAYLSQNAQGRMVPKASAEPMLLFKVWAGKDVDGLKVAYKDIDAMVLELA